MIYITKDNFDSEVEKNNGLVAIDFFANWCGPCRMIAPIFEELEREYPDVKFCKIDVDASPELARIFNVQSIPMIALVKDGTFVDMSVGYVPKATLVKLIEENK